MTPQAIIAMEALVSLQSTGHRSIGEPTAPRPIGVEQGSLLVVLDVNKGVSPAAIYWALTNVVRKGDSIKILGIITHIANAMGFMIRVDQSTRTSTSIMELQFEIATKKEAILKTAHVKEWCQRAEVKLEVDVKAGNNPRVIAVDEAKAMGAYHVVLDKNMKKDRKYFVDNLTCFVSRFRSSSGSGVDVIRSFAMPMLSSSKLPPIVPRGGQSGHYPKPSVASSHRSMSSTSFELGGDSSDDYSAQEVGDPTSAPSTGDSIDLSSNAWIGQVNVAPEMGQRKNNSMIGRQTSLLLLRKQDFVQVSMDLHWPLMHWADSRRGTSKLQLYATTPTMLLTSNTLSNVHYFRTALRKSRARASSGLNYSDMVDSD